MRTYIELSNEQDEPLPAKFSADDVRYPASLVRTFLEEFTEPGDTVFDPFAGFGTTLRVAEVMGRHGIGLEYDEERCAYARTRRLMSRGAVAVVEVSNLNGDRGPTLLAWDIAQAIGEVLRFQGEIVVGWTPTYGYGYDHSYCLLFTRPE